MSGEGFAQDFAQKAQQIDNYAEQRAQDAGRLLQEQVSKIDPDLARDLPFYFGIPMKGLTGTIVGFCLGYMVKQISKKLAFYVSIGVCSIALLTRLNYITINWKKIDQDLLHLVHKTKNEREGLTKKIKSFFTHVAPIMGGFACAFYYAMKYA